MKKKEKSKTTPVTNPLHFVINNFVPGHKCDLDLDIKAISISRSNNLPNTSHTANDYCGAVRRHHASEV